MTLKEVAIKLNLLENRLIVMEARMGINKDNITIGSGLIEENKKTNIKVDKLEDRLKKIEDWEVSTNYLVNNILQAQESQLKTLNSIKKHFIRFAILITIYSVTRDLVSTDFLKSLLDILKGVLL